MAAAAVSYDLPRKSRDWSSFQRVQGLDRPADRAHSRRGKAAARESPVRISTLTGTEQASFAQGQGVKVTR